KRASRTHSPSTRAATAALGGSPRLRETAPLSDLIRESHGHFLRSAIPTQIHCHFRPRGLAAQEEARIRQPIHVYPRTVHGGDGISDLDPGAVRRSAGGHVSDGIPLRTRIDPHPGAIELANIRRDGGGRLQVHRLVRVVECHDKPLQKTTPNVAVVVWITQRATLVPRQTGNGLLDRHSS